MMYRSVVGFDSAILLRHFRTKLGNMCFRGRSRGCREFAPHTMKRSSLYSPFKICLPHQSAMPFLSDACLRKKSPRSTPSLSFVVSQPVLDLRYMQHRNSVFIQIVLLVCFSVFLVRSKKCRIKKWSNFKRKEGSENWNKEAKTFRQFS